jgi:hypothetical protein
MATSPTTLFPAIHQTSVAAPARVKANRRRQIIPEAGHALEKLGHAIDYLTDEYIHEGGAFSRNDPQLKAVQTLMAINRDIYLACPEVPTLSDRWHAWFRIRRP